MLLFSRRKGFIKLALETGLVFLVLTPLREQVNRSLFGLFWACHWHGLEVFFFALNRVFNFVVTSNPKQDLYPPPNVDETECLYVDLDCVLTQINTNLVLS